MSCEAIDISDTWSYDVNRELICTAARSAIAIRLGPPSWDVSAAGAGPKATCQRRGRKVGRIVGWLSRSVKGGESTSAGTDRRGRSLRGEVVLDLEAGG